MRHLLQLKRAAGVSSMYNKNRENYHTSDDEEDEVDGGSQPSSPTLAHKSPPPSLVHHQGPAEWIGITTNSEEDCSYSSADNSESQLEYSENNFCEWNDYVTPILNSNCAIGDRSEWFWAPKKIVRICIVLIPLIIVCLFFFVEQIVLNPSVNCTIWDARDVKKTEMSVLDISSAIIKRVEAIPDTCDYVYMGLVFSLVLSLVPAFCRLCEVNHMIFEIVFLFQAFSLLLLLFFFQIPPGCYRFIRIK